MNKFIALAFFALCATVAHGQIISSLPYSTLLSSDLGAGSASSSSAAAAASSSSAANNGLISNNRWVSPLASPLALGPYGAYAPLASQWVSPINSYGPYGGLPLAGPGLVQVV